MKHIECDTLHAKEGVFIGSDKFGAAITVDEEAIRITIDPGKDNANRIMIAVNEDSATIIVGEKETNISMTASTEGSVIRLSNGNLEDPDTSVKIISTKDIAGVQIKPESYSDLILTLEPDGTISTQSKTELQQ